MGYIIASILGVLNPRVGDNIISGPQVGHGLSNHCLLWGPQRLSAADLITSGPEVGHLAA